SNISRAQNQELFYTIEVPANVNLSVTTSGGSGDADLYVRKGTKPTTSNYDCRPFRNGNSESCSLNSGQGGTYHIMLRGYSAFSNVRLVGQY
ncbi:alkaline serine protease, partial [Pseudoalteromonas ruthenica]